jgi:phage baseplate assembly protein V
VSWYRDLEWLAADRQHRTAMRSRNTMAGVTLLRGDDSAPVQFHQAEGYKGEIRDNVLRYQQPGDASMPLPGAKGIAIYPGGNRGTGIILAIEDTRYRPKGLNPGERHLYMIDGADKEGNGGTLRSLIKGLLGWATTLYGKTINVGDSNTTGINVGTAGGSSLTITIGATGTAINVSGKNIAIAASSGGHITMTAPAGTITANGNVLG